MLRTRKIKTSGDGSFEIFETKERLPYSEKLSFSARRWAKPNFSLENIRILLTLLALATVAASSACVPNQRILESARTPEPSNIAPATSSFEGDLQAMRNADFSFIFVFRRKDGAVMSAEDKAFVNTNTPPDVNRKRLSDEGRAIIIGSNFPFLPGTISKLTERFAIENYSKPDAGPTEVDRTANANSNASPAAKK